MKYLKKISTVVLALMMVLSMGASVFAANNTTPNSDYDGQHGHPYAQQTSGTTIKIPKEIVMFNVDESQIYEPNITYTYEATPATANNAKVTGLILEDAENTTTAVVRNGVADGVAVTTNPVFGTDNDTKYATLADDATVTSETSEKVRKEIVLTVDPTKFTRPGVYRYKIADTTTAATLTASGIKRPSGYVTDLYLDVYMKNAAQEGKFELYGYVLYSGSATDNFNYDKNATTEVAKRSGYDVASEAALADQYHTYNVEITKTTDGALADKNNNFPFKVELTNGTITSLDDFYYKVTSDGTAGNDTHANLAADGSWNMGDTNTSSELMFQNGDGILITGLPTSTSAMVTELNNTEDVYTASAKGNDGDLNVTNGTNTAASVAVEANNTAKLAAVFAVAKTTAKDEIAVKNTLDTISPTNVVMRYAPYLFILGGAVMMLMISRRRKAEQE